MAKKSKLTFNREVIWRCYWNAKLFISVVIEKLSNCPKLQTLVLRGNKIYEVSNLECCSQLWNVDLSNNEVRSV